ncbi:bifunctional phosphoribosylaminoimidazolecarboxamide formyltransferase/IMP cyclohydrolase [uncultured Thalassospira sp.]|uniref:bifunctional phosphoribosylaminoimidazolecarboxamide formyltransferase/IMP cyclohydrolase n=1 Tax=uncultured Thalassospira sp. TaxID=404382 RepID=UPI0030D739E3
MTARIARALISVSDKTGLVEFAKALHEQGVEILSTGGSAKAIEAAGIPVKEVASHTGFPEIMDGRVKTLHPKIHGGLLGRRSVSSHMQAMTDNDITPIDLVAVNLYPFEETVAKGADYDTCIENIDIGGPGMIRSAAKNHESVTVIVDPADYGRVVAEMGDNAGATTYETRRALAAKAYARTGAYDAAISTWFAGQLGETFPQRLNVSAELKQTLRYGENPHQQAAFYTNGKNRPGVATATQLQGKELSFNNLNDTDAAFELVSEFSEKPAVAIIKHANPCGVAEGETLIDAYHKALSCDPVSAFGGIIAVNRTLDAATAEEIAKLFAEVVIAPDADEAAKAVLTAKKNLRVLLTGGMANPEEADMTLRSLSGGYLLQNRDAGRVKREDLKVVTKRAPSDQELNDLLFAFRVGKHVKSNAIVYVKEGKTVGIGAGQMSRVDSSRIAAWKAEEASKNAGEETVRTEASVVSSDAFFPFADGLLAAVKAGATAVIQPSGSMRDQEVIDAADENNIAMVFTGMRHFRH